MNSAGHNLPNPDPGPNLSDLPRTSEDLTSAWLSDHLSLDGQKHQIEVDTVQPLEAVNSFQGNLVRVAINTPADSDLPGSLVVKMVPENEQLRAIGRQLGIYGREAAFYAQIGSFAQLRVPRYFGSAVDAETGDSTIAMEDLSHLRTGDQIAGFTLSEARRTITQYAQMHATWWNAPHLPDYEWLPPWNLPAMVAYIPTIYPAAWSACADIFSDKLSDGDRALGELLGEHIAALMEHAGSGPITLVHGDARHDNLMFGEDESEPPFVVDWQYVASGRGMLDIAYYLTQGGDAELVAPAELELVESYHDAICEGGVKAYDLDTCWEDYRRFALYMLVFPVFTASMIDSSSETQRNALGTILKRGLRAAHRLNSADLF